MSSYLLVPNLLYFYDYETFYDLLKVAVRSVLSTIILSSSTFLSTVLSVFNFYSLDFPV